VLSTVFALIRLYFYHPSSPSLYLYGFLHFQPPNGPGWHKPLRLAVAYFTITHHLYKRPGPHANRYPIIGSGPMGSIFSSFCYLWLHYHISFCFKHIVLILYCFIRQTNSISAVHNIRPLHFHAHNAVF